MSGKCSKCEQELGDDPGNHHCVSAQPIGHIRIIGIPKGEAPKWVRREWIGLIIPYLMEYDGAVDGVLSGEKLPANQVGYVVSSSHAISLLKGKSLQAATWWEENFSTIKMPEFVFEKEVCKIIP